MFDQSSPDTQKQVTAVKQIDNSTELNKKDSSLYGYNKGISINPFLPINQVSTLIPP